MPLRLVDDDLDLSLDIAMSWSHREALAIQLQRCLAVGHNAPFERRLSTSLISILDGDLQPPTHSQISYAISIAKEIAVSIPNEVLRFKGSMFQFLKHHEPIFIEYRQRYSTGEDTQQS